MIDFITSEKFVQSVIVFISLSIFYIIFNTIMKKMLNSKIRISKINPKKNKTILSLINNFMMYFLIAFGIITILGIYGFNTSSLIASLGVISAVVALAFQDTLKDLFAGLFIIIEDQYNIGDTVKINDFKGEVLAVGLRTTKLRAFTGETCFITNRNIDNVINYSMSKSLAIVNFDVSYNSDIDKVEKVLNKLFERLESEIKDIIGKISIDGIDDLGESGVNIRISVQTKPLQNFVVERILRKEIKKELDKNNIEIPFPQVVVHND